MDGCRHDSAALALSGAVDTLDPGNWIGDKGYRVGGSTSLAVFGAYVLAKARR